MQLRVIRNKASAADVGFLPHDPTVRMRSPRIVNGGAKPVPRLARQIGPEIAYTADFVARVDALAFQGTGGPLDPAHIVRNGLTSRASTAYRSVRRRGSSG